MFCSYNVEHVKGSFNFIFTLIVLHDTNYLHGPCDNLFTKVMFIYMFNTIIWSLDPVSLNILMTNKQINN